MQIDSKPPESDILRPVLACERNFITFKTEEPLFKYYNGDTVEIDYYKAAIEKATDKLHKDLSRVLKHGRDYIAPSNSNLGT